MKSGPQKRGVSPLSRKGILFLSVIVGFFFLLLETSVRLFCNQELSRKIIQGPIFEVTKNGYHRPVPGAEWIDTTFEYQTHYKIGSGGFRTRLKESKPINEESPADQHLIFLGDSFAFGHGIDARDCFVERIEDGLQKQHSDLRVLNAGVPAFDQLLEFRYLRNILKEYPARHVVVGFLPNDIFTNRPLDHNFSVGVRENILQTKSVKFEIQFLDWIKAGLMTIDPLYVRLYEQTGRGKLFSTKPDDTVQSQIEITKQLFRELNNLCQQHNAMLVVVSIPQLFQLLKTEDANFNPFKLDQEFAQTASNDGYLWIETLSSMRREYENSNSKTHYRVDGHLTAEGNIMVAEALIDPLLAVLEIDK